MFVLIGKEKTRNESISLRNAFQTPMNFLLKINMQNRIDIRISNNFFMTLSLLPCVDRHNARFQVYPFSYYSKVIVSRVPPQRDYDSNFIRCGGTKKKRKTELS